MKRSVSQSPVLQHALALHRQRFMQRVVCSTYPSLDSSYAIIYGLHVLTGTGELFQAMHVHECLTVFANRWQSGVYLFYLEKINIANTGPINYGCFCNVCSMRPLSRRVWDNISENWVWWMWGMWADVSGRIAASVTWLGKQQPLGLALREASVVLIQKI